MDLETYYDYWTEGQRFYMTWDVNSVATDEYTMKVVDRNTNTTVAETTGTGNTTLNFWLLKAMEVRGTGI